MAFGPLPFTFSPNTTIVSSQVNADLTLLLNAVNTLDSRSSIIPFNYLTGCTLSNDGVAPNTVLDISAGQATDSTNAVVMAPGAFTKSIGGAWTAGTGSNGMGNGLTATLSTWYHVILAYNSGVPDYYFDTSVTGANRPAGITDSKVRRIGSFRLDAAVHITGFIQLGDRFMWKARKTEASNLAINASSTLNLSHIPTGVPVEILISGVYANSNAAPMYLAWSRPDLTFVPGIQTCDIATQNTGFAIGFSDTRVLSDTSGEIQICVSGAGGSLYLTTVGWIDRRGQDG
jgi:hypothetical protein